MRRTDFQFAVKLANTIGWDMIEQDFDFMSNLEPNGCFILQEAQELIGIATCISYGNVGWFGNLVIKKEYRRKGAGAFLLNHAINYLRTKGVETIGLYAYKHLINFYNQAGFTAKDEFVFLAGRIKDCNLNNAARKATERDIPVLLDLDKRCLGWNRRKLLEPILHKKSNLCSLYIEKERTIGFAIAKVYKEAAEFGPVVWYQKNGDTLTKLLEDVLSKLNGFEIYACVPLKETALLRTLMSAGLKENFYLTRMFLGPAPAETCVYMPESLERG